MKDKILEKASEMFLTIGFKSVTMDDIASELGMSKKTIYVHFPNKSKLVENTAMYVFNKISHGIDCICAIKKNPIEEIYDIKNFVRDHLKDEKSSPQYQLQKYYPKVYKTLKNKQYEVMNQCVKENLRRGIELGLYRKNLNLNFISRLYFNNMICLKDEDMFPANDFSSMNELMENYLEYHLRGICTIEGQKKLEQLTKQH